MRRRIKDGFQKIRLKSSGGTQKPSRTETLQPLNAPNSNNSSLLQLPATSRPPASTSASSLLTATSQRTVTSSTSASGDPGVQGVAVQSATSAGNVPIAIAGTPTATPQGSSTGNLNTGTGDSTAQLPNTTSPHQGSVTLTSTGTAAASNQALTPLPPSSGVLQVAANAGGTQNQPVSAGVNNGTQSTQLAENQVATEIWSTVGTLREAQKTFVKNKLVYVDSNGNKVDVVERMGRILKCIDEYTKIIDVAVQHSPWITALVWAGVRFILMVAMNAVKYLEALEFILATVVQKMVTGEFYAQIYRSALEGKVQLNSRETTEIFAARLDSALTELYGAINTLVAKAKEQFNPQNAVTKQIVNMFRPFSEYIQPYVESVSEKERTIQECARMATMKTTVDGTKKMDEVKSLVDEVNKELRLSIVKLDDIISLTKEGMKVASRNLEVSEKTLAVTEKVEESLKLQHQMLSSLPEAYQSEILRPSSLDPELQHLKIRYFEDSQQTTQDFDLGLYIATQGMKHPHALEDEYFDLFQRVQDFLEEANPHKVCLIQGAAGSGKSTFNHHLARELWDRYDKISPSTRTITNTTIPLFISLASMNNVGTRCDLIAGYFQERGWTQDGIRQAKKTLKFVFILDGYDELENRSGNLYIDNRLANWNAKLIVTSRPEYLNPGYRSKFYPSRDNQLLLEFWIAPFTSVSIKEYVRRFISANPPDSPGLSEEYYDDLLSQPDIKALVSSPFLLRMVMSIRPVPALTEKKNWKRVTLYERFIEHWFSEAQTRLDTIQLPSQQRESFEELCEQNFIEQLENFCRAFAVELYCHHALEATYAPPSSISYSRAKSTRNESIWAAFLGNDDKLRLLRFSSPLNRNLNSYRFLHKSLRDYFVAQFMWQQTLSYTNKESEELLLNDFLIVDDSGVIDFFVEQAEADGDLQASLLTCVELSKTTDSLGTAAANAITILVRAGRRFTNYDLMGISIPGADLSDGFFERAQLQNANLTKVRLRNIWLRDADLSMAKIENARWAEKLSLPLVSPSRVSTVPIHDHDIYSYFYTGEQELLAAGIRSYHGKTFKGSEELLVWSVTKQKLVHIFSGHTDKINWTAFSPDGVLLASCSDDQSVRLWSIAPPESFSVLEGHSGPVCCVAFSPVVDQKLLLSGGQDGTARVWAIEDNLLQHTYPEAAGVGEDGAPYEVNGVAIPPDGKTFAVISHSSGEIRIWSIINHELISVLKNPVKTIDYKVRCIAFSPSGQQLAACSHSAGDNLATVDIWSIVTLEDNSLNPTLIRSRALEQNTTSSKFAASICFSPDDQLLAFATQGGRLKLWSVEAQHAWHSDVSSTAPVGLSYALAFSPDSQFIVCVSGASLLDSSGTLVPTTLRQWAVPPQRHAYLRSRRIPNPFFLSSSQDNTTILAMCKTGVIQILPAIQKLHPATTFTEFAVKLEGKILPIPWAAASRDLKFVVFRTREPVPGSKNKSRVLIHKLVKDVHLGEPSSIGPAHSLPDHCVCAMTSDGKLLAIESEPGTIGLWSVGESRLIQEFRPNKDVKRTFSLTDLRFSPDGKLIAVSSYDTTIKLFSVNDLQMIGILNCEIVPSAIVFSPDGKLIASAPSGKYLHIRRGYQIWSVAQREKVCVCMAESKTLSQFKCGFSPDGSLLAYEHESLSVAICCTASGALLHILPVKPRLLGLCWSGWSGKQCIVLSTSSGTIQLWRVSKSNKTPENPSVDVICEWSTEPLQRVDGTNIQGITGLSLEQLQLLKQGGAVGEPVGEVEVEEGR